MAIVNYDKQERWLVGNPNYIQNCPRKYETQDGFIVSSAVTLNPWQGNTVGYDTNFADKINEEYIKNSSPLLYARIVKRAINLEKINLGGFSEAEYLREKEKTDGLYEEGERKLIVGEYRVFGTFEMPAWAQELNKFGMAETHEITLNFNARNLASDLSGSVLHIGDLLKVFDTIRGWVYYEIMDALPAGNFLGQFLMWQVIAKKTDLEGYTELEQATIVTHDDKAPPVSPDSPPPSNKPRPKIY
jgi:hypothetical protein